MSGCSDESETGRLRARKDAADWEARLIDAAKRQALERQGDPPPTVGAERSSDEVPTPESIGPYRIVRRISSGAMGTVYEARQTEPPRTVALKVITSPPENKAVLVRFDREVQLLARLQHPGIARIFEVGNIVRDDTRLPYFSMEYVQGRRLSDHARADRMTTSERLGLLADVCDAIQYVHMKGMIHRDLKPANILVDEHGRPRVVDFGLARSSELDPAWQPTRHGEVLGTLPYMSPEQLRGDPEDIDARTDIFALGVVGYELIAGCLPYESGTVADRAAGRLTGGVTLLGTHDRTWRGDVETMIGKAMQENPADRYQSAAAFADDIRRFLRGEPIAARPLGRWMRLARWARRERLAATLAATTLLLLLVTAVGSSAGVVWISAARDGAVRSRNQLATALEDVSAGRAAVSRALSDLEIVNRTKERQLYAAHMNLAMQAFRRDDFGSVRMLLEAHRPATDQVDLRGFEWFFLWNQLNGDMLTLEGHDGVVRAVAFSPDGTLLASGAEDGAVIVWDLASGLPHRTWKGHTGSVNSVTFAGDGRRLATGGEDGLILLWDMGTGEATPVRGEPGTPVQCVRFSPAQPLLASGGGRIHRMVPQNRQHGEAFIWHLPPDGNRIRLDRRLQVADVAFSPDGRLLATASWSERGAVWDADSGQWLQWLPGDTGQLTVAFLSDRRVAVGGWNQPVTIWDLETEQVEATLPHRGVWSLDVAHDGTTVATADHQSPLIRIWDADSRQPIDVVIGHASAITCVAFQPGTLVLASGSADGTLRLWDLSHRHQPEPWRGHDAEIGAMALSHDDRLLATAGRDATARVWDTRTGQELACLRGHERWTHDVSFSPDASLLASAGHQDRTVRVWDLTTYEQVAELTGFDGELLSAVFSPDGRRLATGENVQPGSGAGALRIWDTATWQVLDTVPAAHGNGIHAIAYSPDGRTLATGGTDMTVKLWDPGGELVRQLPHTGWVISAAFSDDGRLLAAGSWLQSQRQDRPAELKVWDLRQRRELHTLRAHKQAVSAVDFSPDGRTLVSGGDHGEVTLWDLETGDERATIDLPMKGWVHGLVFSSDGSTLYCTSGSATEPGVILRLKAATPRDVPAAEARAGGSKPSLRR